MTTDTARAHMLPESHSEGFKIAIALRNMWDTNERLSRTLPDLSARIAENVDKLRETFDLNWPEFYAWSRYVSRH